MVAKSPPAGVARDLPTRPKTEYKGAANRPVRRANPLPARQAARARGTGTAAAATGRVSAGTADRGRDTAAATTQASGSSARCPADRRRATPQTRETKTADRTAFNAGGGAQAGKAEHKASQRGRSSMGGGGGNKPRKPKH